MHDGVLHRQRQDKLGNKKILPVVPHTLTWTVIRLCHDDPMAGHKGRDDTYSLVSEHYFWNGMYKQVMDYVSGCETCARMNVRRQATIGELMPLPATTEPGTELSFDTIGPLTRSALGMKYIFVCTDRATRMVFADAAPDKEPKRARALLRRVHATLGLPHRVQTDWGTEYDDMFTEEVAKFQITRTRSAPYYPQSNGRVERANATIAESLRKYVDEAHRHWDNYLQAVICALNTAPNRSTGFSPFFLLFGREPRLQKKMAQ